MVDRTPFIVAVAAATLVSPILFIGAVAFAAARRRRGQGVGRRLGALLAFLGGLTLGTGVLMVASNALVTLPLPAFVVVAAFGLWRGRNRVQAAWLVIGFAVPWTALWGVYVGLLVLADAPFEPRATWLAFLAGAVPVAVGLIVASRGDPEPAAPSITAPAGQPGARSYGNLAVAILEPGRIGPFRLPDVVAIVAFVLTWVVVSLAGTFLAPGGIERARAGNGPGLVITIVAAVAAALVATEAHLRSTPTRGRRAFEAFSWYGEYERARLRRLVGRDFPVGQARARRWLASIPDGPEVAWLRAEALSYLGRHDEARIEAARIPAADPEERSLRVATQDLVDFMAGGPGDAEALRAAIDEIPDRDSEAHLRGEVILAIAEVRRRMADGRSSPGDAIDPLLVVRDRLGRRADGQMARALRPRFLRVYLVSGLILAVVFVVLDGPTIG